VATLSIPGFVDAHCHAFQRALRASARGGDFWAWRDGMIALAESLTVDDVRRGYADVYRELRENGYTAVGEFHYLGPDEARAAAAAADEAGIELVLLYACYLRGGSPRFRQASAADYLRELEELRADGLRVGVAPHSVRACPADALAELGR
jgi:formimidoylglutamate deiminase